MAAARRSSYAAVVAGEAGFTASGQTGLSAPAAAAATSRTGDGVTVEDSDDDDEDEDDDGDVPRFMLRSPIGVRHARESTRNMSSTAGGVGFSPNSAAFNCLLEGSGLASGGGGGGGGGGNDAPGGFFTPSHLRGTTYIRRLRDGHRSRAATGKEAHASNGHASGAAKTMGASRSYGKGASHRGISLDVVEKAPSHDEDAVPPLPSRWNRHDAHVLLDIVADGQQVWFGTGNKPMPRGDHEACAVRADHPMPAQCGIYYYEITVSGENRGETAIGIGFSSKNVPLSRLPGWEPESWAYHGDDGNSFCCQSSGKLYGPPFGPGDVVGCGVNFRTGSAFFTKNGANLGTAFREVKGRLFPSVGLKAGIDHIRVNFGQAPFIFDIDGMMALEKQQIRRQIEATSFSKMVPGMTETDAMQAMALQYLTQEGYIETAKAFAEEVYGEKVALSLGPKGSIPRPVVKADEDAGHRQRIRTAILDGDIDLALDLVNRYYPLVLRDNESVSFRLKCRKFVEMIRQGAELLARSNDSPSPPPISPTKLKKSNGSSRGVDWYEKALNNNIDMDGRGDNGNDDDRMDVDGLSGQVQYQDLLQETLAYGQLLQSEFKDDPRREVSQALEEAFFLMAYQDPLSVESVAHLLHPKGRVAVAEDLNAAILHSLGKSSTTALEKMIQQTTVLIDMLREKGGPGAFVNIEDYLKVQH